MPSTPAGQSSAPADEYAFRGSEATKRRLSDAAVDLISHTGILAGLNLRKVAEVAGVNRGNVYHYFGSRQQLLRHALAAHWEAALPRLTEFGDRPLVERWLIGMRDLSAPGALRWTLLTLLAIDRDESVDVMPLLEGSIDALHQDMARGDLDPAHDAEALHIALTSLHRGYAVFREPFSQRLGVSVEELDDRVGAILRHWLEAMSAAPSADEPVG
ncbi:MAG: TetR/AcrR family transcriptional regulator [Actinomycetota bacterium]